MMGSRWQIRWPDGEEWAGLKSIAFQAKMAGEGIDTLEYRLASQGRCDGNGVL